MKEKNIEMTILKAIGIIVVVSCHLGINVFNLIGIPMSIKSELFPEYSYHMPLFIFASGYFYNTNSEKNILLLIKKKAKMIKDYYKVNLFYIIVCFCLVSLGLYKQKIDFSLYSFFVEPFLGGFQFYFNGPGWFVPFLFFTNIMYVMVRKYARIKTNFKNESLFTIILIIIGFISTGIANAYPVETNMSIFHSFLRVLYGIQFFQIGYLYKQYLEQKMSFSVLTFVLVIASKIAIYKVFGYVTFSMRTVKFNGNVFLPFIVSVIGIVYVLYLARYLTNYVNRYNEILKNMLVFIGDNTWSIMMHHLFVKWCMGKILEVLSLPLFIVNLSNYLIIPVLCIALPLIIDVKLKKVVINKIKNTEERKELQEA